MPLPEAAVETTRREWEESYRRVQSYSDDGTQYDRLMNQVGVVIDELRRRIGETFTLDELVRAYDNSDRWSREALDEHGDPRAYRYASLVGDAAFHLYSRGASDYRP